MIDGIIDLVKIIVNYDQKAATLALSRGGWKDWFLCELWLQFLYQNCSAERNFAYPGNPSICDTVVARKNPSDGLVWIEVQAFDVFMESQESRFIDMAQRDIEALQTLRPQTDLGLMIILVPISIGTQIHQFLSNPGSGFTRTDMPTMAIYTCTFDKKAESPDSATPSK